MTILQTTDIILLIILLVFAAWGFMKGLIKALGGIVGIIIAASVASRYYIWLTSVIRPLFGWYDGLAAVTAFAIIFLLIGRLFGFVTMLFEKAFDVLTIIPFLKSINRLLGALFGVLLGVFFLGTLLYIAGKYSEWTAFNDSVSHSQIAQYLIAASKPARLFFPDYVVQLRSYF
jgi:uncharacterized membrane protein required for colicin V production